MATFARIADDETPSISVDARAIVADIDDNIYGGFTEYAPPFINLPTNQHEALCVINF